MIVAKWAVFRNRPKKAGGEGLGEIGSLVRKVSRWHLSGRAGLEGESNAQVDEEKDL